MVAGLFNIDYKSHWTKIICKNVDLGRVCTRDEKIVIASVYIRDTKLDIGLFYTKDKKDREKFCLN